MKKQLFIVLAFGLLANVIVAQSPSNVEKASRFQIVQTEAVVVAAQTNSLESTNSTTLVAVNNFGELGSGYLKSSSQIEDLGSRYGFIKSNDQIEYLGSRYGFIKSNDQIEDLGSRFGFIRSNDQIEDLGSRFGFIRSNDQIEDLGSRFGFIRSNEQIADLGSRYGFTR